MMQMLEPDFWKGKGRYSKRSNRKIEVDQTPITAPSPDKEKVEITTRN